MSKLSRREFIRYLGQGSVAASALPLMGTAKANIPHVVVVGGGFAGATVAKYLRHWSSNVSVTLIDSNAKYQSCVLSNLILNGQMSLDKLTFDYNELKSKYGINIVTDTVAQIDSANKRISLSQQGSLNYDRLVLAPGISFIDVPGLDAQKIPHAWKAGEQTLLLETQLQQIPNGGTFVMTIPKAPYRCPPGPYERACVVADYLKTHKPQSKVVVLDANSDIIVEKEIFGHAFNVTYADRLQYIPGVDLVSVDSDAKVLTTSKGSYQGDVVNVIPPQQAGQLIINAGLANDSTGRWAKVNPLSYESTKTQNIHIIGDSQATSQPKAGHIANAEAKICADAILRLLAGQSLYATPVTNSACYSPISANTASWLTGVFAYDATSNDMKIIPASSGASNAATREGYQAMFDWANNLFSDTFS